MSALKINRREFIVATASVGIGALLPAQALAQTGNQVNFSLIKFTQREAGREHTTRLQQIRKILGGKPPLSEDGLSKLVDFLAGLNVLSKEDITALKKLIKDIVNAGNLEILINKVTDAYKALNDKVGEVAEAIIRIAYESVLYAKGVVSGIDLKSAIYVVSSDVSGALNGAATGGQLGGKPGAIVGAVIGAVSTSASAVFDPKC